MSVDVFVIWFVIENYIFTDIDERTLQCFDAVGGASGKASGL